MDFPCIKCGLCCRSIKGISELSDYDDGNGVCRCLENNLCSIYDNRPLVCNVEAMYERFFKSAMTEEQFTVTNLKSCQELAKKFHNRGIQQKIGRILADTIILS